MGNNSRRIPTGVPDFDSIIKGGLPEGSVVLLIEDPGAGNREFVYTSAFKLALVKERPEYGTYYLGNFCDFSALPDRICYVTFSRPKEDILRQIADSFDPDFHAVLSRKLKFKDFSANFFKSSIVPPSWTGADSGKLFAGSPDENMLESLIEFLDENSNNSMVIIDSLTDLIANDMVEFSDLVSMLKGIQRVSKRWNGIIYVLMTQGIVDNRQEQILIDSVDGVLRFEWTKYLKSSKRQRYLYIDKFMSLLAHLDKERIARFPTMVTASSGMVVVNMEMIR